MRILSRTLGSQPIKECRTADHLLSTSQLSEELGLWPLLPNVPRKFFWLIDFIVVSLSFILDYRAVRPVFDILASWLGSLTPFVPSFFETLLPLGSKAELPPPSNLLWMVAVFVFAGTSVMGLGGCNSEGARLSRSRILLCSVAAGFVGLTSSTFVVFLFRIKISRLFTVLLALFASFGFGVMRLIVRAYREARLKAGCYCQNAVVVGLRDTVRQFTDQLSQFFQSYQYKIVTGLQIEEYEYGQDQKGKDRSRKAWPELKQDLTRILRKDEVNEVIAIQPTGTPGEWLDAVIGICDQLGTVLRIVPEPFVSSNPINIWAVNPEGFNMLPALTLVPRRSRDLEGMFVKRVVDIVISASLLVALSPLFCIIALAIRLTSRGPVLYPWHVVGQNGKKFVGCKFRTMVLNADELKGKLEELNEMRGPVFKIKDDPRVTPIGRILRKYSLDELPQLYSVLKGDMSLVGPRPVAETELERFEFWQVRKLSVRSGITCLWQVCGRNEINDFSHWVRLDLEYIDEWSLWLDFKILIRTVWVVLKGTGR